MQQMKYSMSTLLVFVFMCACVHKVDRGPVSSPKTVASKVPDAPSTKICESESYVDDSDYKPSLEKEYVNKLGNSEEIFLQTEVQQCEEYFNEGIGLECGIKKKVELIWTVGQKVIDTFVFLETDCQEPSSASLKMIPWDVSDVLVKNDLVKVQHFWNYYSRSEDEDQECKHKVIKLDRVQMKFQEQVEQKCDK